MNYINLSQTHHFLKDTAKKEPLRGTYFLGVPAHTWTYAVEEMVGFEIDHMRTQLDFTSFNTVLVVNLELISWWNAEVRYADVKRIEGREYSNT